MLKEDDLVTYVLENLQAHINNVVSLDKLLYSMEQLNYELIAEYKEQIADNEAQLANVTRFKTTLYDNLVSRLLDKSEYKVLKDDYEGQAEKLREAK